MLRRPPRSTLFPTRRSSDLTSDMRMPHRSLTPEIVLPGSRAVGLDHGLDVRGVEARRKHQIDRKSTRLNSSHGYISYAVFCLKKKTIHFQSLYSTRHLP